MNINRLNKIIALIMLSVILAIIPCRVYGSTYLNNFYRLEFIKKNKNNRKRDNKFQVIDEHKETEDIKYFSEDLLKSENGLIKELKSDNDSEKLNIFDIIKFMNSIRKVYSKINIKKGANINSSIDLARITSVNASLDGVGPITVTPAKLNGEEITLITLGGTQFLEGQATGLREDLLAGFEHANDYLTAVIKIFDEKDPITKELIIPKDKPIVISGISLGGMVAQQLLEQDKIMNNYEIKNIVCFGSPLIAPTTRNIKSKNGTICQIKRICDKKDLVPKLGAIIILDEIKQKISNIEPNSYLEYLNEKEQIFADGGFKTFIGAHALSYVNNNYDYDKNAPKYSGWKGLDALGILNGDNKIILEDDMKFYFAPTLDE